MQLTIDTIMTAFATDWYFYLTCIIFSIVSVIILVRTNTNYSESYDESKDDIAFQLMIACNNISALQAENTRLKRVIHEASNAVDEINDAFRVNNQLVDNAIDVLNSMNGSNWINFFQFDELPSKTDIRLRYKSLSAILSHDETGCKLLNRELERQYENIKENNVIQN